MSTDGQSTAQSVKDLPWVQDVRVTSRDEASHVVLTRLGVLRETEEVRELQNCGATIEAFAPGYHGTMKAYVTL